MPRKEFFSVLIAQAFFAIIIGVLVAVTAQLFVEGARYLLSFQEATEGFVITVSGQSFSLLPIHDANCRVVDHISSQNIRRHEMVRTRGQHLCVTAA